MYSRERWASTAFSVALCRVCCAAPSPTALMSAHNFVSSPHADFFAMRTARRVYSSSSSSSKNVSGGCLRTTPVWYAAAHKAKTGAAKARGTKQRRAKTTTTTTSKTARPQVKTLHIAQAQEEEKTEDLSLEPEVLENAEAKREMVHRTIQLTDVVRQWSLLRLRCRHNLDATCTSTAAAASSGSGGGFSANFASSGSNGGGSNSAIGSTSMTLGGTPVTAPARAGVEVSPVERVLLLSTLVKEFKDYPQLHALFYPESHGARHSNNDISKDSGSGSRSSNASHSHTFNGADGASSDRPHAHWTVEAVEEVLASEQGLVELMTLLRTHAPSVQSSSDAASAHTSIWDAVLRTLHTQLVADVKRVNNKSGDRALFVSSVGRSVAQALHVVVGVHRQLLARTTGNVQLSPTKAKAKKTSAGAAAAATAGGVKDGKAKRTRTAKSEEKKRQSEDDAAMQALMARVLADIATPVFHLYTHMVSAGCFHDAPHRSPSRAAPDASYDVASVCVMMTGLSAVAEEAAGLLARDPHHHHHHHDSQTTTTNTNAAEPPKWSAWHRDAHTQLVALLETQRRNVGATAAEDEHAKGSIRSSNNASANSATVAAAAAVFVDALRCLRWTEELEVVLRVATLATVSDQCQRTLLLICRAAEQSAAGTMLFEALCRPSVAAELNRLSPDRVTYAQAVTDLCTLAAAYVRQQAQRIPSLVEQCEHQHHREAATTTSAMMMTMGMTGSSERTLPPRPQMHSPVVQLLYAMLCCGFAAPSLLTSSLCLSLAPRDTVEAVRAADLFSVRSGTAPLPVRTRAVLVDRVVQMAVQCRRDGQRVVVSTTDAADSSIRGEVRGFALRARLADGAAAEVPANLGGRTSNNASGSGNNGKSGATGGKHVHQAASSFSSFAPSGPAAAAARKGERTAASKSKKGVRHAFSSNTVAQSDGNSSQIEGVEHTGEAAESVVSRASSVLTPAVYRTEVNHTLYVCLEVLVECVLRGDVAAVDQLSHAILPLLEHEGHETALTEALEYVYTAFAQRLRDLGRNDLSGGLHICPSRTLHAAGAKTKEDVNAPSFSLMQHPQPPQHCTSAAMEEALALLPSLFLPHMTEAAMKMLTNTSPTAVSGTFPSSTSPSLSSSPNATTPATAAGAGLSAAPTSTSEQHSSDRSRDGHASREAPSHNSAALRSDELIELALRLTTVALLCGMPASTIAQLTTLHNTLLKSQEKYATAAAAAAAAFTKGGNGSLERESVVSGSSNSSSSSAVNPVAVAFGVVERLERLLTELSRQALPWRRAAHSAYVRHSNAAVQQVLALYIASTAATVREVTQQSLITNSSGSDHQKNATTTTTTSTTTAAAAAAADVRMNGKTTSKERAAGVAVSAQYRHYLLTVVHLLYRLSTEFPVELEPPALRQFRVDVLDPALTSVLLTAPHTSSSKQTSHTKATKADASSRLPPPLTSSSSARPSLQMPLTTLTEVVVVMCVPESVQHVSPALIQGVVAAVEQHLKAREEASVLAPSNADATAVATSSSSTASTVQSASNTTTSAATALATSAGSATVHDGVTGVLVTQLLSAAATLCLRADDTLTVMLLQLLDRLGPLLTLWQTVAVLERLHATGAPLSAPQVRRLIERLVRALQDAHNDKAAPRSTNASDNLKQSVLKSGRSSSSSEGRPREHISASQQIRLLHTLSAVQRSADVAVSQQRWSIADDADAAALLRLLGAVPYTGLMLQLVQPRLLQRQRYSVGECGLMVEVVADLLARTEAETGNKEEATEEIVPTTKEEDGAVEDEAVLHPREEQHSDAAAAAIRPSAEEEGQKVKQTSGSIAALRLIPRTLAVYVLQSVQLPFNLHDVPLLLRGYAALASERGIQQQILRAFISRTIRAAPALSPAEIVICVEAYCAGDVFHQQLYGVLLGRAADTGRQLSLELSVRLLRCGTLAGHAAVQTVCVTAVQPIFSSQVRGLLQSDPHMLVSVASTALAILHCLRDCFPQDAIGSAVLANVARYRHDASLSVIKAALELMEQRGSTDYDVAHVLARHCIENVLPTCSANELANVTCLLVACGLRSAALLEAVYARLAQVVTTMPGSSLAKLAQGLLRAAVEVDATAAQLMCTRITALTHSATASATTATTAADVDSSSPSSAPPTKPQRGAKATTKSKKEKKNASVEKTAAAQATESLSGGAAVTPANGNSATLPVPLTLHQVCIFLHLLRSVGRRLMGTAMSTVDALLTYAQGRVEAELAMMTNTHAHTTTTAATTTTGVASTETPVDRVEITTAEDDDTETSRPAAAIVVPPSPPVLAELSPREVEEVLRTCIELSTTPKQFDVLTRCLADHVAHLLQDAAADVLDGLVTGLGGGHGGSSSLLVSSAHRQISGHGSAYPGGVRGGSSTVPSLSRSSSSPSFALGGRHVQAWYSDLILLVDLCNLFVRLGESQHPVVPLLLDVLYERRGMLMQRALLVKTTRTSLELAGRAAHPELYKLLVDGEIV